MNRQILIPFVGDKAMLRYDKEWIVIKGKDSNSIRSKTFKYSKGTECKITDIYDGHGEYEDWVEIELPDGQKFSTSLSNLERIPRDYYDY